METTINKDGDMVLTPTDQTKVLARKDDNSIFGRRIILGKNDKKENWIEIVEPIIEEPLLGDEQYLI